MHRSKKNPDLGQYAVHKSLDHKIIYLTQFFCSIYFLLAFPPLIAAPLKTDFSWGKPAYTPDSTTGEWLPTEGGFFWSSALEVPSVSTDAYSFSTYPTGLTKLNDGTYLVSGQLKEINSATRSFLERFSSNGSSLKFIDTRNPNSLIPDGGGLAEQNFGGNPPLSRPLQSSDGIVFWPLLYQDGYPPIICNLYRLEGDLNSVVNRFLFSAKRDGGAYLNFNTLNGIKPFDARVLMPGPNGSIYTLVTTAPKGIARLTSSGSFDTSFAGDGFLDITPPSGNVFAEKLPDDSVIIAGYKEILRMTEEGGAVGSSSSLVYLNSSHPGLSSFSDVNFLDVIKMPSAKIRVLGFYRRYFGSSSKVQVFSFESESIDGDGEVIISRINNHILLDENEIVDKAQFDHRHNIIVSRSKGSSHKISIIDYPGTSIYTTSLNDGLYRKTVSGFPNSAYYVSDFIIEPGRLIVLSGHAVQALLYPDDSDGDGLWDSSEESTGTGVQSGDSDSDGLSDWEELVIWGLDPLNQDSDRDGIPDGFEVNGYTLKATATVTLGNLSQTYDGTARSATATTDPSGKTVVFTYDGEATAPTTAGSSEVVGTIEDQFYQGSATGNLVIAKATQSITFANPGPQLATATVNLSATGGGSGNPVTFAFTSGPGAINDSNQLTFTGSGSVTITASQAGNANFNPAEPVAHTFNVSLVSQTITFDPPGARFISEMLTLAATGGGSSSGIVYEILDGPGEIANGNELSFTGGGSVTVRATQAGDDLHDAAMAVDHTFEVILPKPDIAVGSSPSALVGVDIYLPTGQLVSLTSKKARPVNGYVVLANRVVLPDDRAMDQVALRGTGGNALFKVTYLGPSGNVTAGVITGTFLTDAIDGDDASVVVRAAVTPNKKKLTKKKKRRKIYLRKTFTSLFQGTSMAWPDANDAATMRVLTR